MEEIEAKVETFEPNIKIQLAKVVFGTLAGFIAGKLTEAGIDYLVNRRKTKDD